MKLEIFFIGIGGDGVLTIAKILASAFIKKNYNVSVYPFYGSEQRGGEVCCVLKVDDEDEIVNPILTSPNFYIILNDKFLEKYKIFENETSKYLYVEDEYKNQKNKNVMLLRKFVNEYNIIENSILEEAISERFK